MGRRKTGFGLETGRPLGIVGAEEDMVTGGSRLKVGVWLRCGLKGDVARNRSWKMGFTIGKAKTAGEDLG